MLTPNNTPPKLPRWEYAMEDVKFEAPSFPLLVDMLCAAEPSNPRTRHEIEQEILTQIKVKQPWLVSDDQQVQVPQETITQKFVAFLGLLRAVDLTYVEPMESVRRARICLKCPRNVPDGLDDAGKRQVYISAQGRLSYGMGWCEHHEWHCGVSVNIEGGLQKKDGQPEACWA